MTRSVLKRYAPRRGWNLFLLLACIFWWAGCSMVGNTTKALQRTTKKITREITSADGDLKKKVGVIRFENKVSPENPSYQNVLHDGLLANLQDSCNNFIVTNPSSGGHEGGLDKLPRLATGQIDNFALAGAGRQLGLNAIVTGSLNDIAAQDDLQGILWMKDNHYFIRVLVRLEVYDTYTGSKILDEDFPHEIEIDEMEYELIKTNKEINPTILKEALEEIVSEIVTRTCDALGDQSWNGYITSVEGDKISISSGSEVGLATGRVLAIYDSCQIIEGIEGCRFYRPGPQTGELKIVKVFPQRAEAVLVSGGGAVVGNAVRTKE
ncbi:MAG: hypothetical protein JSW39_07145 [Desulfobacterales bacterium]|nr:MAG: hypothetical protein JSW39_07145 [Desulfobacterales bacterium]